MGGGAAAAAAAAMPVVGVLIGFGVSRAIRGGKERKYKRAMEGCLNEYGYEVGTWAKARKKEDAASLSAANVKVSKSLPDVVADQSSQPSAAAPAPAIETSQPSE